jgi:hypothetical protein
VCVCVTNREDGTFEEKGRYSAILGPVEAGFKL